MKDVTTKVVEKMGQDGFDGLVFTNGSDIKYLTGFTGEYDVSVLLITSKKNYFITDGRFEFQAQSEVPDFETVVFRSPQKSYCDACHDLIQALGLKRVGYQGDYILHQEYETLVAGNEQTSFVAAPAYVTFLRRIKTPAEIATIKEACRITERSFYALLDFIKPGVTEIDIANEIEYQFRSRGGSGFCFDTIVASGPDNGANCHATPSERKIQKGDFITIDFGTRYQDYCSDMTRTVAVGEPTNKELVKIYQAVKEAKKAGEAILKAGVPVKEIDQVVREVISTAGYSIPHGIGHGFGLDIHEDPFISANNPYVMEAGVVHTIEPGIYVPGVGGVRIEDDYLIEADGAQCFQQVTNELIIL